MDYETSVRIARENGLIALFQWLSVMLRRTPTTVELGQEDVAELIAELEEQKLQLRIQSQRKNLVRSTLTASANGSGKEASEDIEPESSGETSVQISPLDGKRLQLEQSEGPPTATLSWSNRQAPNREREREQGRTRDLGATGDSHSEENPFFRDGGT